MNIQIRSQNFKINEKLEDYATGKLERLNRYLPKIGDIYLDIERHNTRRGETLTTAQITLRHERGAILRAEEKLHGETTETVEAAINAAVDKMYRQIERFKGKNQSRKGKSRFTATLEELDLAETIPDEAYTVNDEVETDQNQDIVRRKKIELMPMNEQEALEQMELLGHTFFVFFNAETNGVNVIYKRADGDYGVLQPQVG